MKPAVAQDKMMVVMFDVEAIHFLETYNEQVVVVVLVMGMWEKHVAAYVVMENRVDESNQEEEEVDHHNNRVVVVVVQLVENDDVTGCNNQDVSVVEPDYDHKHDGQVDNNDVMVVVVDVLLDVYL